MFGVIVGAMIRKPSTRRDMLFKAALNSASWRCEADTISRYPCSCTVSSNPKSNSAKNSPLMDGRTTPKIPVDRFSRLMATGLGL